MTWDASTVGDWVEELEGADAIVHLNGRRVDTQAERRQAAASPVDFTPGIGSSMTRVCAPADVLRRDFVCTPLNRSLGADLQVGPVRADW